MDPTFCIISDVIVESGIYVRNMVLCRVNFMSSSVQVSD